MTYTSHLTIADDFVGRLNISMMVDSHIRHLRYNNYNVDKVIIENRDDDNPYGLTKIRFECTIIEPPKFFSEKPLGEKQFMNMIDPSSERGYPFKKGRF